MGTWRRGTAVAAALAVIGTGAAGSAVLAASTGGGTTGAYTLTERGGARPNPRAMHARYEAALAKQLGISVAALRAAEKKADEAVLLAGLDAEVAAGRLSQAEADALRAAAANGTLQQTLTAQARERLTERLDADVKAGRITQAREDELLKQFDQAPARRFGHLGMGPGLDGPGMPGGMGGPGGPPR